MLQLTSSQWNDLPVASTAVIPDEWIDFMGHMNVMWYTHLFGKAVLEFFNTIGLTQKHFTENNTGSFVLEQHVRYLAEIRVGERVSVRARALSRSEKKLHFIGFLVKEDNEVLAATAEVITAYIDMSQRRTSTLPSQIAQSFDDMLSHHANLPWNAPVNGFTHA